MIEEILMKTSRFGEPQILAIFAGLKAVPLYPSYAGNMGRAWHAFIIGESNTAEWMRL